MKAIFKREVKSYFTGGVILGSGNCSVVHIYDTESKLFIG